MKITFAGFQLTRGEHQKLDRLDGLTPTQQLARAQAESVAFDILAAFKWSKRLAWVVLLAVMAVSFEDQFHYLVHQGFRPMAAILVACVFDLATVFCVTVIGAAAMKLLPRLIALGVVLLPVGASGYINVQASPTKQVAIIYILVVAMIPAIEVIKAFMGVNFRYMRKIELDLMGVVEEITTETTPAPKRPRRVVTEAEEKARLRDNYAKKSSYGRAKWRMEYDAKMVKAEARKGKAQPTTEVADELVSVG